MWPRESALHDMMSRAQSVASVGRRRQPHRGRGARCLADLNGTGVVAASDLTIRLGSWGPSPGCPADLDDDGDVDAADLAILLGSWGPCP